MSNRVLAVVITVATLSGCQSQAARDAAFEKTWAKLCPPESCAVIELPAQTVSNEQAAENYRVDKIIRDAQRRGQRDAEQRARVHEAMRR